MNAVLEKCRRWVRRSPACNWLISQVSPAYRILAVKPHTEIVIEGFPRCANTFAVVAFRMPQPRQASIAHHLHSLGQVRRGVQREIPTLILVREPRSAVLSLAIRKDLADVEWALDEYIDFHGGLAELGDRVVVAEFREVTCDFGAIVRRVNQRFGTNFAEFVHTEENVAECYRQIDGIERYHTGGAEVRATHVARPTAERSESKDRYAEQLEAPAAAAKLRQAERLYAELCRMHSIDLT